MHHQAVELDRVPGAPTIVVMNRESGTGTIAEPGSALPLEPGG